MKPTSHFLGLSVKCEIFNNLFNSLKNYIKENHLEDSIELQNASSLHISLYYFGKEISVSNLDNIKKDLIKLNQKENSFPVYVDQFNFFERKGSKYLGYLYPSENYKLERINSKLKQHYLSEVPDNDYPKYIPHISIFRIKDESKYQKHHSAITTIIGKHLKLIEKTDSFKIFNLYSVDSNYSPEKQEVLL